MKSLVAAGTGCLVLLAITSLDRPKQETGTLSASAQSAGARPASFEASYDLSFVDPAARPRELPRTRRAAGHPVLRSASAPMTAAALGDVVKKTCAGCHSDQRRQGNLSLQNLDLATIGQTAPDVAEKMISKLRTGMMPPPGRARPGGDTLQILMESLERWEAIEARASGA